MENTAFLRRFIKTDFYTIGRFQIYNSSAKLIFEAITLELPYRKNEKNISCIPTGYYEVIKRVSEKYGECFQLQNVANRAGILIHTGNFYRDTKGCILLGSSVEFMNDYTKTHLLQSQQAMKKLNSLKLQNFTLKIQELC